MTSHRFAVAGFAIVLCLAGCTSGSSPAEDAATDDGPAASDEPRSAANTDGSITPRNDGSVAASDLSTPADTSDGIVIADVRLADVATIADGSRAEGPAPDVSGGDATADAGCAGWTTLQRLSPAQASELIASAIPIVINVHIPYEGDIPGTDVDIPYNDVDAIEAYLNYDHCADILLVCLSGGMSQSAGNQLIKRGYLRVRDINGGMSAWVAAGYPLLKDGGI
jgi:rhodanese-related sulfurtransferase